MSRLIPLSDIPYSGRAAEREARRRIAGQHCQYGVWMGTKRRGWQSDALRAAEYEIVMAPGCHSRPYFDPPTVGWVLTASAASALASRVTHMPGGTSHRRLAYSHHASAGESSS